MQPLPHEYNVTVAVAENDAAEITSRGLPGMTSAPPREFDGPGDLWSPETLLVAAAADCLALTFRAIAKVSKLKWTGLVCGAQGRVDRSDGVTRFTGIRLRAILVIPDADDLDKARKTLEKAETACLVANSLKCATTLETEITIEEPALSAKA